MGDKSVRNLAHLEDSASTARVLNLLRVHKRRGHDPAHTENPFFKNPTLNRAIVLKHRLRRHERDLFMDGRQTATKLIIPIDGQDLRLGGRSVFVDQLNYDSIMENVFGESWMTEPEDRDLLAILDGLPSLDPFLLREQLRRHERHPARCYFEISDADMSRMFKFVEGEIQKLVDLCYGGGAAAAAAEGPQGSRQVSKILSNAVDAETEPLRLTLRLEKHDYQEGVFCWKGFLYYKWTLAEALPGVSRVAEAIAKAKPRGALDTETKAYLEKTRESLRGSILTTLETAKKSLRIYDAAFASLIDGKPQAFREFLLSAPGMFCELGERLGAVSHIVSFWSFRFPQGRVPVVTGPELMDIFADFESSLSFPEPALAQQQLAG
ncbi:MAG: hypothetical protein ACHP7N_09320 [Caulobacterales bacterium]